MADWENRSSRSSAFRGVPGGISPSEERRLKLEGRQQQRPPVYQQQYPAITDQFRNLIADPRTGQMHEATIGPYAGPTISPAQWMSQHPLFQLGNMFARMSAAFAPSSAGMNYSDPFQAPPGVDRP